MKQLKDVKNQKQINQEMTKHLQVILKKMCSYVDVNFDEFNFKDKGWYLKYEWSNEQENEFKDWFNEYMKNNKEAQIEIFGKEVFDDKRIENNIAFFLLNYGWKTEVKK